MKGGCSDESNRFSVYVTIASMIAGLPLRLASSPRFSASEVFRIRHLLAVTADAFGDLHEVGRIDMGAVVDIGLYRDPVFSLNELFWITHRVRAEPDATGPRARVDQLVKPSKSEMPKPTT